MFLNDDDFDEPEIDVPISRFAQVGRSNGPKAGSLISSKDQEDDDMAYNGSAQSSSRARMLAQQRELLMKKRQDAFESGGMVRSSADGPSGNSPLRKSAEHQFTPAVRQFSAPKSVKDASAE